MSRQNKITEERKALIKQLYQSTIRHMQGMDGKRSIIAWISNFLLT